MTLRNARCNDEDEASIFTVTFTFISNSALPGIKHGLIWTECYIFLSIYAFPCTKYVINSQEYFILNVPYLFHVQKSCAKEITQDISCPLDLYLTKYIIYYT